MHFLRTHPMVIAFAFILSILLAFFAGSAWGAETDSSVPPTVPRAAPSSLAPMPALGAESAYMGLLLERSRWDEALRWVALAQIAEAGERHPGGDPVRDRGVDGFDSRGSRPPQPSGSGDCYDGSPVPASVVTRESGGDPNVWNQGGSSAWGCYQILGSTWNASCSDIGVHGSASVAQQKECASRLPSSAWGY